MSIDDTLRQMTAQQRFAATRALMEKLDALKVRYGAAEGEFSKQKILQLYKSNFAMLAELTQYKKMIEYVKWYNEMKGNRGGVA